MKNIENYVVVQSQDNKYTISPIPKIWLLNKFKFSLGEMCKWYWPTESPIKKSEYYTEVDEDWAIKFGFALNTSGNNVYIYIYII